MIDAALDIDFSTSPIHNNNGGKLEFHSRRPEKAILKTYEAISYAHLSRVWKLVKLSGSCLSTINGFGLTQLSDILMSYHCSDIFLTK